MEQLLYKHCNYDLSYMIKVQLPFTNCLGNSLFLCRKYRSISRWPSSNIIYLNLWYYDLSSKQMHGYFYLIFHSMLNLIFLHIFISLTKKFRNYMLAFLPVKFKYALLFMNKVQFQSKNINTDLVLITLRGILFYVLLSSVLVECLNGQNYNKLVQPRSLSIEFHDINMQQNP